MNIELTRISTGLRGELARDEPMAQAHELARRRRGGRAVLRRPISTTSRVPAQLPRTSRCTVRRPRQQPAGARRRLARHGGVHAHRALNASRSRRRASMYAEAGVASPKVARFAATHDCAERRVPRRHSRHGRRRARDERRLLRRRDLALRRARRGARRATASFDRAHAGATTRSAIGSVRRARRSCAGRHRSPPPGSASRRATATRRAARIKELLARRIATQPLRPAQRRLGVPQSRRRPRRAPDRGLRPEGLTRSAARGSRRSTPTSSSTRAARATRRRHRGADRARAGDRARAQTGVDARAAKCASSGRGIERA